MASYTSNYQLHQWVPEDDFLRTDFNTDFQKIDTAIKAVKNQADGLNSSKAEIVTGSYTGDGAATRTVTLGFRPTAVLLENRMGARGSSSVIQAGLALWDAPLYTVSGGVPNPSALEITATGFTAANGGSTGSTLNIDGTAYQYIVVK